MQYNTSMKALVPPHKAGPDGAPGDSWRIELDGGERRNADSVVLATGGLSFPAVGTDGTGHNVVETVRSVRSATMYAASFARQRAGLFPRHIAHETLRPYAAKVTLCALSSGALLCSSATVSTRRTRR